MLPREKFMQYGVTSLSISELIAVILSTGSKKQNVYNVSKEVERLLKRGQFSLEELSKLNGVGVIKAMKLLCSTELGYRLGCTSDKKERITSTEEAANLFKSIANRKQENLLSIFLNARYEVVGKKIVAMGTVDRVQIFARDIIIPALTFNSTYIVIGHNHPSGDCNPSKEDIDLSRNLQEAFKLVGLTLLDHLVVFQREWRSVDFS